MNIQSDWANRWLGGFCAVGVLGGLPVRGPDYAAHPPLEGILPLPSTPALPSAEYTATLGAWRNLCGERTLLIRSTMRARELLLQALDVAPGEAIGLPANATRVLAEVVKHYGARPHFLSLNAQLQIQCADVDVRVAWMQPYGGVGEPAVLPQGTLLVDASDSLPSGEALPPGVAAVVYGLFISGDPNYDGALIVVSDSGLADALERLLKPVDLPNPALAMAQYCRVIGEHGLIARQHAVLQAVREGLEAAAGLPILPILPGVLAHYIAVRIPEPCDPATFYAYVHGEQTPVRWLPFSRPLHYAALRADGAPDPQGDAERLARVLLVPVGPEYTEEEMKHAILGITKAADYLGVRWSTDPDRAVWYADLMVEWYGADHDAYRKLFSNLAADATDPRPMSYRS